MPIQYFRAMYSTLSGCGSLSKCKSSHSVTLLYLMQFSQVYRSLNTIFSPYLHCYWEICLSLRREKHIHCFLNKGLVSSCRLTHFNYMQLRRHRITIHCLIGSGKSTQIRNSSENKTAQRSSVDSA